MSGLQSERDDLFEECRIAAKEIKRLNMGLREIMDIKIDEDLHPTLLLTSCLSMKEIAINLSGMKGN